MERWAVNVLDYARLLAFLWQSDDARMHKTTQIPELRIDHRKLTRIGGYVGTRQTPMKSQGILLEGAVLIERFLRNPYANAPQDCGCPDHTNEESVCLNDFLALG